jgi:hypothetical protein
LSKLFLASTNIRRVGVTCLAALALAAALAACGSSSSANTAAGTSGSRFQARVSLAKCARAHGINVPDPSPGGGPAEGIGRALRQGQYSQAQINAALQACRQYLAKAFPQFNLTPAQRAQFQQQLVKFAECMRSHGVNVPDPSFNGNGAFGFRQAFRSIDRNSPAFQSALKACQSLRPRFGRGAGGPAGGGVGPGGGPGG